MSLDDVFGGIGKAFSPLQPAVDFLLPQTSPGQGTDLGSLFSSFGEGIQDTFTQGSLALTGGLAATFDPNSGMSPKQRLLTGGLTALGAGMLGREGYRAWKASRLAGAPEQLVFHMPSGRLPAATPGIEPRRIPRSGFEDLVRLGDEPRFAGTASDQTWDVIQKFPGLEGRQASVAGSTNTEELAINLGSWAPDLDEVQRAHMKVMLDQYTNLVGDSKFVAWDMAKFDLAYRKGLFKYDSGKKVNGLWRKFTENPKDFFKYGKDGSLTGITDDGNELLTLVKQVSEAADQTGPDFGVGIVGKVSRIDFSDSGTFLFVDQPVGWKPWSAIDHETRTRRLYQLNYRNLAEHGRYQLRNLYMLGMDDLKAGGGVYLPKAMDVGPEWYPVARADVARVFGLENTDSDAFQRAVAAVSFLSEAEDWSTNIAKAHRLLTNDAVQEAVADVEFQSWLRDSSAFTGRKAKQLEARFESLHKMFTNSGESVYKDTTKVVLRLVGDQESVMDIFASTTRRKQRNFYLNIYHPELEYPVTIDRHAFDAFLGMDTGVSKRPIDLTLGARDQVYDVVADTYRSLAAEFGVSPHQLQAVVWETWRMLKEDRYLSASGDLVARRGGWATNDPFFLPSEGSVRNEVFDALNGHTADTAVILSDSIPASVLELDAHDITSIALPNDSTIRVADGSLGAAMQTFHLYPAIEGLDRLTRWARKRPDQVRSIVETRRAASYGDRADVFLNADLDKVGGHPLTQGRPTIVYDLGPGEKALTGKGWRTIDLGTAEVDGPEFHLERVHPDDFDVKAFKDPVNGPMGNTRFAVISAHQSGEYAGQISMTPKQSEAAYLRLEADLKDQGYKTAHVKGVYGGEEEASIMIFGISAEDALALGRKFKQDSVLVNEGYLYSDGGFRPQLGLEFDIDDPMNRSTVMVNGKEVTFRYDFDWDPSAKVPWRPEQAFSRASRVRRKVGVQLSDRTTLDIFDVAKDIEDRGRRNVVVYANQISHPEWRRAYESLHTDGVQTYVQRTATGPVVAANGGYVFMRNVDGLGRQPVQIPPVVPDGLEKLKRIGFEDGRIVELADDAQRPVMATFTHGKSKRVLIEMEDLEDVTPALELRRQLEVVMPEYIPELKIGSKTFAFPKQPSKAGTQMTTFVNGLDFPRPRIDKPLIDFTENFGYGLDVSYRVGNVFQDLDERTVRSLYKVTQRVNDEFGDAVRRFGLRHVTVSPGTGEHYGAFLRQEQVVVLAKEWWSDIPKMTAALKADRELGVLARNAPPTPESVLVHEYGHVIFAGLRNAENWVADSAFEKGLLDALGLTPKRWSKVIKKEISTTAASSYSELVAEALSEVLLSSTPSPYSVKVVDYVRKQVDVMLSHRRAAGL